MGARCRDRNGSNILADGAKYDPEQNQSNGVNPRIHLGEGGGYGLHETSDRRRGNLQRAEEVKGKLRHVWCDGGGVLP